MKRTLSILWGYICTQYLFTILIENSNDIVPVRFNTIKPQGGVSFTP